MPCRNLCVNAWFRKYFRGKYFIITLFFLIKNFDDRKTFVCVTKIEANVKVLIDFSRLKFSRSWILVRFDWLEIITKREFAANHGREFEWKMLEETVTNLNKNYEIA